MHFTESHEWIRVQGKIGTVGITNYAQNELGEIVFIELPKVGSLVKAGKEVSVLESTKAAADVYSPVSGKIVKVNEELKIKPQTVNQDPEKTGWLFQIELDQPNEIQKLMTENEYKILISS